MHCFNEESQCLGNQRKGNLVLYKSKRFDQYLSINPQKTKNYGLLVKWIMIYNYSECIQLFGNNYSLEKAISEEKIFKIQNGVYSEKKS